MQVPATPIVRDIVLVGGGHSHVVALRYFAMHPLPGVRITLICTDAHTPYSGMLPGYVAGHYSYDDVHIDLCRLCAATGARFIQAEVTGLDREARTVQLRGRPDIDYDVVSINTGSTPQMRALGATEFAVPVKPITGFNQRWLQLLDKVAHATRPLTIAIVGGGAGGVELCLAMQYRLSAETQAAGRANLAPQFHLFTSDGLLPTHNAGVQRRFTEVLAERGVQVHLQTPVAEVEAGRLRSAKGEWFDADDVLWVTQAGGGTWLQGTGLALTDNRCIRLHDTLQSITDPRVFAAGDVAAMENFALEKAGVFAVRMGMPLAINLQRAVQGLPPQPYRPQRHWLALISTGDKFAVASRGALGFAGAWVWLWKDWIDRRFMQRFSVQGVKGLAGMTSAATSANALIQLSADEAQQAQAAVAMRCGGCGAKVGASVLSRALQNLWVQPNPDVLLGLDSPDDAAVVRVPPGKALVHSVDFFRAFVDDPYVFGRIAANHALGDLFGMGAQPHTATAIATVPPGVDRQVEATLRQMMQGAVEVLNAAGCTLIGGHSGEGAELALGFAVNGLVDVNDQGQMTGVLRKGDMQPGDVLLLTKPIGTGALFAAHGRAAAKGRWVQAALQSMVQSNQAAAQTLRTYGATACTDLTGFGLIGHTVEMARPSGVQVVLDAAALPLLDGALECVQQGLLSSLHSANARQQHVVHNATEAMAHPLWPLLVDPQTAGGLLASVPASQATACLADLRAQGYAAACAIGHVRTLAAGAAPVHIHIRPEEADAKYS
ncbi:selenide, water dikinase SelD [Rhodoferax sp. TBRC 17198]|uniref:selenide, water dikinase SelD n=1 Tax=Rhodoferax potami TaxID=3068338 RepID=UPI0028BF1E0C|nr:selenide, water dikinase SelD [Rhodoferax sp. TBRC 17198]MDT7520987.1 selenide, water dikinase SelD [Rhodoferax sp. TBRC 17198]